MLYCQSGQGLLSAYVHMVHAPRHDAPAYMLCVVHALTAFELFACVFWCHCRLLQTLRNACNAPLLQLHLCFDVAAVIACGWSGGSVQGALKGVQLMLTSGCMQLMPGLLACLCACWLVRVAVDYCAVQEGQAFEVAWCCFG